MDSHLIPVKTAQGHDELSSRQRRVGQRHRTLLLLVDGQRTIGEVLHLSGQAGVPEACLEELISLGLVVVPQSGLPRWYSPADELAPGVAVEVELRDLDGNAASVTAAQQLEAAVRSTEDNVPTSTLPDTEFGMSTVATDSVMDGFDDEGISPAPLEDARDLLIQAVSTQAPVTGALTLIRLKRARTPMEILALIREVQQRIDRPHRAMATQHMMGRVAQLLSQAEAQLADY